MIAPEIADHDNVDWFAGLADGEGSFNIVWNHRAGGGRQCLQPRFSVGLRLDDEPILVELKQVFGGSVCLRPRMVMWTVVGKADLAKLVGYFDLHPLRTRKAKDYATWREAVVIYVSSTTGPAAFPLLQPLREKLMTERKLPVAA